MLVLVIRDGIAWFTRPGAIGSFHIGVRTRGEFPCDPSKHFIQTNKRRLFILEWRGKSELKCGEGGGGGTEYSFMPECPHKSSNDSLSTNRVMVTP